MANLSNHFLDMVARGENPHRVQLKKDGLEADLKYHRKEIARLRLSRPLTVNQQIILGEHIRQEALITERLGVKK